MLLLHTTARSYGIALGAVLAALAVRTLLDPVLGPDLPFYAFYFAITAASVTTGLGPGLAALAVSCLSAVYFFVLPRYSLVLPDGENIYSTFRFVTVGLLLVFGGAWVNSLRTKWRSEVLARRNEKVQAVKTQQATLDTLASLGDGLITVDAEGRITYLNAVAEQLSGWLAAAAKGRAITEVFKIVHGTSREEVPDPLLRSLREERAVSLPECTVLIGKDGSERAIDDSAAPIRDPQGRITGAVLVFRELIKRNGTSTRAFEVAAVELYPAPGSHVRLGTKDLEMLEGACRTWLEREWVLDAKARRIVGLKGYNLTIQQASVEVQPTGIPSVLFIAAYGH